MIKALSLLPVLFLSSSFLILGQESEQGSSRPEDVLREGRRPPRMVRTLERSRWFGRDHEPSAGTVPARRHPFKSPALPSIRSARYVLEGQAAIQGMIEKFAEAHTDLLPSGSSGLPPTEESRQLFHLAEGPWGGTSVGVQYVGVYTLRENSKRFMYPGAAFFQIREGENPQRPFLHGEG